MTPDPTVVCHCSGSFSQNSCYNSQLHNHRTDLGGDTMEPGRNSHLYSQLFGQFIKLNRPVQTKLSQSLHSSHKYIVELRSLLRSDLVIISSVYISVFMYILISNKSIKICIKLHLNKNIEELYSVFGSLLIL